MKVLNLKHFFFSKNLTSATWTPLREDSMLCRIEYAKGSEYKAWESKDFSWIVFRLNSKTPDGSTPGKFIHKF